MQEIRHLSNGLSSNNVAHPKRWDLNRDSNETKGFVIRSGIEIPTSALRGSIPVRRPYGDQFQSLHHRPEIATSITPANAHDYGADSRILLPPMKEGLKSPDSVQLPPFPTLGLDDQGTNLRHGIVPPLQHLPRNQTSTPMDVEGSTPANENQTVLKPVRQFKVKKYFKRIPSHHCHICRRSALMIPTVVCLNIRGGLCRKVVCQKCFETYQWDFESAAKEDSGWLCTHCREVCPPRAQCFIYQRVNTRRKIRNMEKMKARKLADMKGEGEQKQGKQET
uniref:Zinc-finger domain-containing protein n=1 Tax=Compsopogon caeruleus TaxID=31354 RepID=A0A7S1TIE4_9RHOD|mmetsp:Transcript_919/g.1989  ORF Transcript_919/g.1989 Transcript_919/m.1989 type:complete len:279 (+) Transcript_919:2-838(+)